LQRLPHCGAGIYWRLLEHFPNLKTALMAPLSSLERLLHPEALAHIRLLQQGRERGLLDTLARDLDYLARYNIQLIDLDSEHYPRLLRETKRAPPLLYVLGNLHALELPQIAIVGSRHPSSGGVTHAFDFAKSLAEAGFAITSGLALGIDVAAHEGALAAKGVTLGVLGTGIDQIYPVRHKRIAEEIVAEGGAVLTEFPLGVGALPTNFPQRNRIISGMSCGVLVVEAAVKSGSLITARYALQQDREVFAIPGSIQNPLSRGCHALIKDGATLVEQPEDIVEQLQGLLAFKRNSLLERQARFDREFAEAEQAETADEKTILRALGFDPLGFDQLVLKTQLPAGELMASLLTLELKGVITQMAAGYCRAR
jgi:DNA processing protein